MPTLEKRRDLFVLGAGSDVAYGLPTIAKLMVELAEFSRGEGSKINKALRARLPHLQFSFDKYAGSQGEALVQDLFANATDLSATLRSVAGKLREHEDEQPVAELLEQLCAMADRNQLSGAGLAGLAALAGEPGDVGDAEPLLDPGKVALSPIPARAVRSAFQQALIRGANLSDDERAKLEFFIEATSNIEQLLSHYFTLQATTNRPADRKTFLYLSWMLWSFLRFRSAGLPIGQRGIYARLRPLGGNVITFNYTNFFDPAMLPRVRFFHGRLDHVLRAETREVVTDDAQFLGATDVEGIAGLIKNVVRLDVTQFPFVDLPSIVPPVSFKPVMSRSQLKTWMECDDLIQAADAIVIVGYSFAAADEHFNDLIRNSKPGTKVMIVNTKAEGPMQSACRILGLDPGQIAREQRGGFDIQRHGRLTSVVAGAETVDATLLSLLLD